MVVKYIKRTYRILLKGDKKVKRKAKKEKRSESSIIRELIDNLNNHD